jgi:hypothetical protein
MLAVAGILGQEIFNPSVFFYEAAAKATLPFDILGLVAVQFLLMHFVEIRRWRDFESPGSVDKDPIFTGNALPPHDVGYPGGIFDPMKMSSPEMKVKELKNGRLAMCVGGPVCERSALAHPHRALPCSPLQARLRWIHHERAGDGRQPHRQPVCAPGIANDDKHVRQGSHYSGRWQRAGMRHPGVHHVPGHRDPDALLPAGGELAPCTLAMARLAV